MSDIELPTVAWRYKQPSGRWGYGNFPHTYGWTPSNPVVEYLVRRSDAEAAIIADREKRAQAAQGWSHWEARIKALMEGLGQPNSRSLYQAFSQLVNEMAQASKPVQAEAPSDDAAVDAALATQQEAQPQAARMIADFPALSAFHEKYALGPMLAPSCLCCGQVPESIAIKHAELPGIVICKKCRDAAQAEPAGGNKEDAERLGVLVECLTDEGGTVYCLRLQAGRKSHRSAWKKRSESLESLAFLLRKEFDAVDLGAARAAQQATGERG